jgi:O-antigen/teichoic acid export membrane protein
MGLKKTLFLNISSGWIEKVVSTIVTIVIVPILVSHFGKYKYGLWMTIGQGAALLALADFGIANSIARFISRNYALHDTDENIKVYSTAMVLFFLASVIALAATAIVLPFIPDILHIETPYHEISFWLFGLIGLNTAVTFPLRVGRGLLQSRDRYDLISLYGVIVNIANLILTVLIFGRGRGGLLLLAGITLGLNLFTEIALFIAAMKQNPDLRFKYDMITRKNFKEITSLGSSAMIQTASGFLYRNGLIFVVGMVLGVSSTPLFSIPHSILMRLSPFINRLGSTLTPIASRLEASDESNKLRNLNMLSVRYGLAISLPLGVFLLFYSQELLTIWLGRGRSGLTGSDIVVMTRVLVIVLIPFVVGSPQMATRSILGATGKHWLVANSLFLSALFGLIMAVLMMLYTNLGILAAAIGMTMRYIITDMLLFPFIICRYMKISAGKYFINAYARPLASAFLLSGICFLLKKILNGADIINIVIAGCLFAVMSCVLIVYVIATTEHRKYLSSVIKEKIAGLKYVWTKNIQ